LMGNLTQITGEVFQKEVLGSDTPVVVEFGATWCAPCKMLEPVLTQLSQEWGSKARIVKIDVDESSDIAQNYGIMSVPTVILFKKGQAIERFSGFLPKDRVIGKLGPHL
jgi:thioredoxin 1